MTEIDEQSVEDQSSIFYRIALWITQRPTLILLFIAIILVGLLSQLRFLQFDTSTEGFLSKEAPSIVAYEKFRDQFGRDDFILIAIHHDPLFSKDFISTLKELHEELESNVPWVSEVDSIINARRIIGQDDDLIVEDFFEGLESNTSLLSDESLAAKQQEAKNNPLYQRLMINDALTYTTVVITLQNSTVDGDGNLRRLVDDDFSESIKTLETLLDSWQEKQSVEVDLHLAGSPMIVAKLKQAMMQDMRKFTLMTIAIIALFLLLLFRRASGVALPLLIVMLSVASTIALMALSGAPIQLPTVILPSFILAVAVGDAVHFLTLFYQHFDEHPDVDDRTEKSQAIALALGHAGTPMMLTTLTTAVGLASFAFAEIVPVANVGIYAASGVCIAFLLTIIILPCLLMLLPIHRKAVHAHTSNQILSKFTDFCIQISAGFPKIIIMIYIVIAAVALMSASQIRFSHDPVKWLPDSWDIRQATKIADEELRGTVSIEILIDTKIANGIKDPVFLNKLALANKEIASYEDDFVKVRKVISVVDILKESNKALHGNEADYYSIPETTDLVAQELFLLELSGADDLEKLIDSNYQLARVTVSIPWIDTIYYDVLLNTIVSNYEKHLGNDYHIQTTGIVPILGKTLKAVITSAALSYALAFVLISFMLIIMLKSFRYGLLAMLPNIIPIIITLGMMKFLSAPLDMFSMLIASIALGLSVDDTIHFMHHFRLNYEKTKNVHQAIEHTLHSSGRAMLVTSVVLCCGFMVYTFSEMNNLDSFGFFTALTIALALLADFLLAPALMIVSHKQVINK